MIKCFNIDIDKIITDYKLSYQKANDEFINKIMQMSDNLQKLYPPKVEELDIISKQISDINGTISKSCEQLQNITIIVEKEEQIMHTDNDSLITLSDDCRFLREKENELKDLIDQTEKQLTQLIKEKKGNFKKFKKDVKAFKAGVDMYEKYLQVNMNIKLQENNSFLIDLAIKNYNVVFEEKDKDFNLVDITPRDHTAVKVSELYNHNKDIQGLLAYLYKIKE